MTQATATLYGLGDRGVLAPGLRRRRQRHRPRRSPAPPTRAGGRPPGRRQPPHPAGRRLRRHHQVGPGHLRGRRGHRAPARAGCCGAPDDPAPSEVAAGFWAALYDRDWDRIRSFFGPDVDLLRRARPARRQRASDPTASRPASAWGSRAWPATSTRTAWWPRARRPGRHRAHRALDVGDGRAGRPAVRVGAAHRGRQDRPLEGLLGPPDPDGRGPGRRGTSAWTPPTCPGWSTSPAAPEPPRSLTPGRTGPTGRSRPRWRRSPSRRPWPSGCAPVDRPRRARRR